VATSREALPVSGFSRPGFNEDELVCLIRGMGGYPGDAMHGSLEESIMARLRM